MTRSESSLPEAKTRGATEKVLSLEDVSTEWTHYIEYPDVPGYYFIEIFARTTDYLVYYVTVGNSDLSTIVPQRERIVLSAVGYTKKWEINTYEASQIFFALQMCEGIVNIFGSASRAKIEKG